MFKATFVLLFLLAAAITAWRLRSAKANAARFLTEARTAGFQVLPLVGDEEPVKMGRVRLAATVRVFEYRDPHGNKQQEFHNIWTLTLRGDEASRGTLEVKPGAGDGYGGMSVPVGRRLSANVKDASGLDVLTERAKDAIASLDRAAPLVSLNAVGPELSASFGRRRTDLATAKKLADGFEAAARALGR